MRLFLVGWLKNEDRLSAGAGGWQTPQRPQHDSSANSPGTFWSPPPIGWLELNCDDAFRAFDGSTSCGGLVQDSTVELDCLEALKLKLRLCNQDPRISPQHMNRNSNKVADSLAKLANSGSFYVVW
ncbi:hypothetical protein V6N13_101286 [Hibiscus sabdariffa]